MKKESDVRIMFVDNDLDYLEMVEAATALTGDTLFAMETSGASALTHLSKVGYKVDAIITDLAMSDIDGITLTEQIRRNERIRRVPPIDIYWFTGFDYDEKDVNDPITKAATDLDVRRVFNKPYDVMEIIGEVKHCKDRRGGKTDDFNSSPAGV